MRALCYPDRVQSQNTPILLVSVRPKEKHPLTQWLNQVKTISYPLQTLRLWTIVNGRAIFTVKLLWTFGEVLEQIAMVNPVKRFEIHKKEMIQKEKEGIWGFWKMTKWRDIRRNGGRRERSKKRPDCERPNSMVSGLRVASNR